jgi:ribonuclease HI
MGLHLLNRLSRQLTHPTVLGTDSQAIIRSLNNQLAHSGQYLLNAIHQATGRLHEKQDGLINHIERLQTIEAGEQWKGNSKGVINLQIHWVPGHCDFGPNERADKEVKLAAQGSSSDARFLPPPLHKKLLLSIYALQQENSDKLKKRWQRRWKSSEGGNLLCTIDNSALSKKYSWLISELDFQQTSLLFQLCLRHIGQNHHPFRICKSESPACPKCQGITVETVKHFLIDKAMPKRRFPLLPSK